MQCFLCMTLICKFDGGMELINKTMQKSLMSPDKKKTLSVYLNHTKGCNSWVSRKAASILSTNMRKVWQARYQ